MLYADWLLFLNGQSEIIRFLLIIGDPMILGSVITSSCSILNVLNFLVRPPFVEEIKEFLEEIVFVA